MKALQLLFKTNDGTAPLIARLMLGIVMFPHGAGNASLDTLIAVRIAKQ